ncbi:MAG: hypothetical protein ACI4JU_03055 [Angelakisella sp.]
MKKLIAFLMALIMIFTLSCPVFAATAEMARAAAEAKRGKQIETNIKELLTSYKATNDAEEQTAIFNELVACYSELDSMEFYHSSIASLASNYVTITNKTVSNNKATITYRVNMAIPNGATVSIGFEYPGAWQQSSPAFIARTAVGTYTQTISTNIMTGARYFSKLTANSYTEKQTYGIYYGGLKSDGTWNYAYHTVTAADVKNSTYATTCADILMSIYFAAAKVSKMKVLIAGAIEFVTKAQDTTPLGAGQYIKSGVRFVDSTMYVFSDRYASKSSYDAGDAPLESSTLNYTFTGYPTN